MDNENKDFELESQNMEPEIVEAEPEIVEIEPEVAEIELPEIEPVVVEEEFDPTESEDFYSNLDAAIGAEEVSDEEIPELLLNDEIFALNSGEDQKEFSSEEDALFAGVDAALTEQIEHELGKNTELSSTEEKEPNKFVAAWKVIPRWTKILVSIILVVLISVGLLFGTEGGRKIVYKVALGIVFHWIKEEPEPVVTVTPEPGLTSAVTPEPTKEPDVNQNPLESPVPTVVPPVSTIKDHDRIINVLLLGEENIGDDTRGRTDAIILVSINLDGGPIKVVSFLRDLFVAIPGWPDDKLNKAYSHGGAELAMAAIEKNFGVDVDSYVKINFNGFENIIDELGGLRISLTATESEYLNTTLYISKPEERNTVAGYQNMTGSQVLGYCRVRYVPIVDDQGNVLYMDTGRNYRHRVVLKAIFEKYKEKKFAELIQLMPKCFSYVSAPVELEDLALECLTAVLENQMFEIETLQMPKSNLLSEATIRGEAVICFFPENVDVLQEFLYGEE